MLGNTSPWCKHQKPLNHSLKITLKCGQFDAKKFKTLRPFYTRISANHRPRLGLQAGPRCIAPHLALPRPSHLQKWQLPTVEVGGRLLQVSHQVSFITLRPPDSSNAILAFSKIPLIYPTIPIRPSRFVLLISLSKLLKTIILTSIGQI